MTQKELLYVEDAIGHEQNLVKIATETINLLQNVDLKNFISCQLDIHNNIRMNLMNLLEGEVNE